MKLLLCYTCLQVACRQPDHELYPNDEIKIVEPEDCEDCHLEREAAPFNAADNKLAYMKENPYG